MNKKIFFLSEIFLAIIFLNLNSMMIQRNNYSQIPQVQNSMHNFTDHFVKINSSNNNHYQNQIRNQTCNSINTNTTFVHDSIPNFVYNHYGSRKISLTSLSAYEMQIKRMENEYKTMMLASFIQPQKYSFKKNWDDFEEGIRKLDFYKIDFNMRHQMTGNGLLHFAVILDDQRLTKFLIQKGANPLFKNKKNQYPIDLSEKNSDVYKFLEVEMQKKYRDLRYLFDS